MKTVYVALTVSLIVFFSPSYGNDYLGRTLRIQPPIGQEPLLVLLIETQDFAHTYSPEEFREIFFGNKPSVKNYFWEQSYQQFELTPAEESFPPNNDGIIGWIRVSKKFNEYDGPFFIVKEAIELSSRMGYIDYSRFDVREPFGYISTDEIHIYAIIASYEGSVGDTTLYPRVRRRHYATKNEEIYVDSVYIGVQKGGGGISLAGEVMKLGEMKIVKNKVGPLAHEIGHDLGLPEHYFDEKSDSFYESASAWCLQGTGDGDAIPKDSDFENLNYPNSICAPHRVQLQWVEPIRIQSDGNYTLNHIDNSVKGEVFQLWENGNPGKEYFIVENRLKQLPSDYDSFIPNSGLLIWHIDSARIKNVNENLGIAIEDANNNGRIGEAGDVFSASTRKEFLQKATEPNSTSNDGSITGVAVYNISDAAMEMSMTINVTHEPVRLDVAASPASIKADGYSRTDIRAFLIDVWDDTVETVDRTVVFRIISGEEFGVLVGPSEVETQNGAATTQLRSTELEGAVQIEAGSEGLGRDTVTVYTYVQNTEVSGYIRENTTWTVANSPYEVTGDIIIEEGVVLTIEAGVVVKSRNNVDIKVKGGLIAEGTPYNPIIFTSADRELPGAWGGIQFESTAMDASSRLRYCEFYYAGDNSYGVGYPIVLDLRANPIIEHVTVERCRVNAVGLIGGSYHVDVRLDDPGLPLWLSDANLVIEAGAVLTIEAGVLLKMSDNVDIYVRGGLIAEGTAGSPIVFTSYKDDHRGGDTNGDGSSAPLPGDWGGIQFESTAMDASSRLRYCEFYYAGDNSYGVGYPILCDDASPLIQHITIDSSKSHGIYLRNNARPDMGGGSRGSVGQNRFLGFLSDPNKYAIYNNSRANVFAQYNYWETNIPAVISDNIYDFYDNNSRGRVYFEPFNETGDFDPPSITVISPNGGEKYHYGESHQIQWNATDQSGVYQIILSFSIDGGDSYEVIDTVSNSGRYNWIIPDVTSYYCRVKATAIDVDNNVSFDVSDKDFWITSFAPPENRPPETPKVLYPENNSEMKPEDYFIWSQSTDPNPNDEVSYHIQIDDEVTFSDPEINYTSDFQESRTLPPGKGQVHSINAVSIAVLLNTLPGYERLSDDQIYYWRVRAVDNYGATSSFTDSTNAFFFNKVNSPPYAVTHGFSPTNGDTVIKLTPEISWFPARDPDWSDNESNLAYILQISKNEFRSGYDFQYRTPVGNSSVFLSDTLTDDTFWYYRIKTVDDEGAGSNWSAIQAFYTYFPEPPGAFSLVAPVHNDTIDSLSVLLDWENSIDPDKGDRVFYRVWIAPGSTFDSLNATVFDSLSRSHLLLENFVERGITYSWRVYAYDDYGFQVRCNQEYWSFTVDSMLTRIPGGRAAPRSFFLAQNFPNPFNPVTTIPYGIPEVSRVTIEIFNLLGQRVEVLLDRKQRPGYYQIQWNAGGYPSGVYWCRMTTNQFVAFKKLLLLK